MKERRTAMKSIKNRFRSYHIGMPPGTLLAAADRGHIEVKKSYFEFSRDTFEERELAPDELPPALEGRRSVTWLNYSGINDSELLEQLGEKLRIHPLALEDIQNLDHRPKIEEFDSYLHIIFKMLRWEDETESIDTEQVSVLLGRDYVVTFQEREGDVFDPIRERIRKGTGRVRKSGADYLAYALIDTVIDNYYLIVEQIEEKIETMEEAIHEGNQDFDTKRLHHFKRQAILLRRAVWPLREMIANCLRDDYPLIGKKTKPFLKDVYDHVLQAADSIELIRELLVSLTDAYNARISNSTNSVMSILTIIATIFIPLTFIAGIYGMNFTYMPELTWRWGYFTVLGVMAIVGLLMYLLFKRRKWL
jgi:magnesium transporter